MTMYDEAIQFIFDIFLHIRDPYPKRKNMHAHFCQQETMVLKMISKFDFGSFNRVFQ